MATETHYDRHAHENQECMDYITKYKSSFCDTGISEVLAKELFRVYIIDRHAHGKWKKIEVDCGFFIDCTFILEKEEGDWVFNEFAKWIQENGEYIDYDEISYHLGNFGYKVTISKKEVTKILRRKQTYEDWREEISSFDKSSSQECRELSTEDFEDGELSYEEIREKRYKNENPRVYEIMKWVDGYDKEHENANPIESDFLVPDPPDFESDLVKYNEDGVFIENGYWISTEE